MAIAELAGLSAALGAVKTISEIAKNVNNVELIQKVIDLQSAIMEMQRDLQLLQTERHALTEEIRDLKEERTIRTSLEYANHVYWRRDESGTLAGPFCTTCWDASKQLVRLTYLSEGTFYECNEPSRLYKCAIHNLNHFIPISCFSTRVIS